MPTPDPHWTAFVSAFFAPLVALGAAYIAIQNLRTAKHKIKIDLFEKRLKVFERLSEVADLATEFREFADEETPDPYLMYVDIAKEARWLFDQKTVDWMNENIGRGIQSFMEAQEQSNLAAFQGASSEKQDEARERVRERRKQLNLAQHNMLDVFTPHLQLHKL